MMMSGHRLWTSVSASSAIDLWTWHPSGWWTIPNYLLQRSEAGPLPIKHLLRWLWYLSFELWLCLQALLWPYVAMHYSRSSASRVEGFNTRSSQVCNEFLNRKTCLQMESELCMLMTTLWCLPCAPWFKLNLTGLDWYPDHIFANLDILSYWVRPL